MSHAVQPPTAGRRPRRSRPPPRRRTRASATHGAARDVGLVTRAIAFALDAALINVVAIVVGVGGRASLSVLSVPSGVETALLGVGGVAYVLWSALYFVTFWSTTGQTPGDRLLGIRVCRDDDGGVLRPVRALVRLGALTLAAIPLFAGFLPILSTTGGGGSTTCSPGRSSSAFRVATTAPPD